jgi:hypothetical protein
MNNSTVGKISWKRNLNERHGVTQTPMTLLLT